MEKRVFLAILLSFGVLALYQAAFPPVPPSPVAVAPASGAAPVAAVDQRAATVAPPVAMAAPLVADAVAREIVVETDAIRAVFSTAGGTLTSWKLKRYLEAGQPLELLSAAPPQGFPPAFALMTADPAVSAVLGAALFRPSADGLSLGSAPGQLSFEYRDVSGLSARKTFYFQPESKPYVVKVEATVDQNGASRPVVLASGALLGPGYAADGSQYTPVRAVQHFGGSVSYLAADSIQTQPRYEGEFKYFGVEDKYFLHAALPSTEKVVVEYQATTSPVTGSVSNETRGLAGYRVTVPGSIALPFFIGPKDFEILRAVDPRRELVLAIDFGMFRVVVVPLLTVLNWVNGFVGNYGWSIVVTTILVNLLVFPFRHKSMVSMRKMQAVQPDVKAIQERFAKYKLTDPERQKMNTEMMALYKQKGVNPASGCVPMLLTLPVLFAFYAMLAAAIELRGAPFFGWIVDLSTHDPLYITPVLMGASMFWQQKMMPTTADPIQQKVFLLMPIIFTVSFLWAPAGLVVYWFVSNILAIGQQYLTNHLIAAPVRSNSSKRGKSIGGS
jgi:YidC/Oxa1 family membrane protein insertase